MTQEVEEIVPHRYTKSHGDGSPRHHCSLCGKHMDDPIHQEKPKMEEEAV